MGWGMHVSVDCKSEASSPRPMSPILSLEDRLGICPSHPMTQPRLKGGRIPPESVSYASGSVQGLDSPTLHYEKRGRSMHPSVSTCGTLWTADTSWRFGSGDGVMPGPPSYDSGGDMGRSEDHEGVRMIPSEKARAARPSTTDDVAPQELWL